MKTKLQIIEETRAYYEADTSRRAVIGNACAYIMEDGRMCAVGRCMLEDKVFTVYMGYKWLAYKNNEDSKDGEYCGVNIEEKDKDNLLKEEYRGMGVKFWCDLQLFHDGDDFWNEEGLTEEGLDNYGKLVRMYS